MRRFVVDVDFSQESIVNYVETFEQSFYPVFYRQKTQDGLRLGYGDKHVQFSEFLDIVIDAKGRTVSVERDVKSTLILLYYFRETRLIVSSDYRYFAQELDLVGLLNEDFLVSVIGVGKMSTGSISDHVSFLYPRRKYFFSSAGVEVEEVIYSPQQIEASEILHQNFCNLTPENVVGAEISGGKDSAFLPILSKKSTYFPFALISGQLHTGEEGKKQWKTISGIIEYLGTPYEYHTITEDDYPLKHEMGGDIRHPVEEIYKNSLLGELEILKKHGINTIFTGFGGDEAFEVKQDPSVQYKSIPYDILGTVFQEDMIDRLDVLNNDKSRLYTDTIFQPSVYDALIARNNIYIEHGIRPMTPYLNIDIYAYFQSFKVSKQVFFDAFYANFDDSLAGIFSVNTNMTHYFSNYIKSDYFARLLELCLEQESFLHQYYHIDTMKEKFAMTQHLSDAVIQQYSFFLFLFVKMSLMLKDVPLPPPS